MFEDDDEKEKQPEAQQQPVEEQEEQKQETQQEDAEGGGEESSEQQESDESKKGPKDRTPPWMQRRINKEVAEKHALRRENEELKKRLSTTQSEETRESESLSEEEVERRAEMKVARREFDKACNRTYDAGVGEFSDFSSKLKDLRENVGELPIPMIEVINDLEGGHKILHYLATDFEEAARIYEMPLTKMAVELAKLGDKLTRPRTKPISKVPPPVNPVGGGKKTAEGLSDSLSDDEWIRRRNEQRRKAGKL